jgi:hypothetical protein
MARDTIESSTKCRNRVLRILPSFLLIGCSCDCEVSVAQVATARFELHI